MQRRVKQSKIYRTKLVQMSLCRDEGSKVKYTELKYCKCQYSQRSNEKWNMQNRNTADINYQRESK